MAGSGWYRVFSISRPHPFHCAEPKAKGLAESTHLLLSDMAGTGPGWMGEAG